MKKNYFMKKLSAFLAIILIASFSFGQTVIYTETFDDTLSITNTPDFQTDGYGDYFLWGMDGDFGMVDLAGEDGLYYIGAEDTDADGMPGECSVTLPSVSLSGYSNVKASILLAAPRTNKYDEADYIIFEYEKDGSGTFVTLGAFYGHDWVNGDATNGDMREDTDLDGYANETGTQLTDSFQTFAYDIDPTATSIVVRVRLLMNSGSEEIAFDNIVIYEDAGTSNVDVTMNVDMNYQITLGNFDPAVDTVDVAGDMNTWAGTVMADPDSDGVYSYTFTGIPEGTTWEYKFRINGNWELNGLPNRSYTTVAGVNVVDHFYDNNAGPVDVTFTVEDGTASYLDIEIKGTMTNWATVQMYDDGTNGDVTSGDHIWTVILSCEGGNHEWGAIENDGTTWGLWLIDGSNLTFTVNTDGTYTGQTSYVIPAPGNIDVTFNVNMSYQITLGNFTIGVDSVDVAGTMNGYGGTTMTDPDGDSIYSVTIGGFNDADLVEYKFRINTNWELAGQGNRQYTVDATGVNEVTHWYDDAMPPLPDDMFFSEYIEGSSNNKAFEIYNPTADTVNLDEYLLKGNYNGNPWSGTHTFPAGATLAPGDVWVIANADADSVLIAAADETFLYNQAGYIVGFNGNDARGLFKIIGTDTILIDIIGDPSVFPTVGWDVAGVSSATANHTLIRKSTVVTGNTDWTASAGTDATNSEWVVFDINTFDYIGFHPHVFSTTADVTFNVNMTYQETIGNFTAATDSLDVAGNYNSWAGDLLTDPDADGIYSITYSGITVGDTLEFKFRINSDWATSEFPGGGPNRTYIVQSGANVLDFWYNDEEPSVAVTIYDIQYTTDPSGDSPYAGQNVQTSGLVTAITSNGYFLQDGTGAWNGIYVYDTNNSPAIGDNITIIAEVAEYYNLTELKNLLSYTLNSSGNVLPPAAATSTFDINSMEAYEGVLVQAAVATCTDPDAGYGEWIIDDGTGTCTVDDLIYSFTPDSAHQYNVTGVITFSYGNYKLEPRDSADIEDITVIGDTQSISIIAGWSIFSTYIDPFTPSLDDIFAPIISEVRIVKDGDGLVFWPAFTLNAIGNLTIGEGYQINLITAQTLDITGTTVVPETTALTFTNGWSIIGYLRTSPADISVLFASIAADMVLCKNGEGLVYWPLYGVNAIGNMVPGAGYQLNMITTQVYTYPANGPIAQTAKSSSSNIYFQNKLNTGSNMTLGIPVDAWENTPSIGDEIGIFNSLGNLVGSSVFTGDNLAITIWGNDEFINSACEAGKSFTIRNWNHNTGNESSIIVESWESGSDIYADNAISIAAKLSVVDGLVLQNYPNPALSYTEIEYSIDKDSYVNLTVYNSIGEVVEVLVSEFTLAGTHKLMLNTSSYEAGVYLYTLSTPSLNKTKALHVVK